jgi:hypothetical protein
MYIVDDVGELSETTYAPIGYRVGKYDYVSQKYNGNITLIGNDYNAEVWVFGHPIYQGRYPYGTMLRCISTGKTGYVHRYYPKGVEKWVGNYHAPHSIGVTDYDQYDVTLWEYSGGGDGTPMGTISMGEVFRANDIELLAD